METGAILRRGGGGKVVLWSGIIQVKGHYKTVAKGGGYTSKGYYNLV